MKDWIRPSTLSRLTLQTNCVIVVHSPSKSLKVERVEWRRRRVYKQCQSTTSDPSRQLHRFEGSGWSRRFPPSMRESVSGARGEILAAMALFSSPGQREVDPSVHSRLSLRTDATSLQIMPLVSVWSLSQYVNFEGVSIRLSIFYKLCNRRQMGHLSPFPTVDSSLDVRPSARLSTKPSVTLARPRRVMTDQEKRVIVLVFLFFLPPRLWHHCTKCHHFGPAECDNLDYLILFPLIWLHSCALLLTKLGCSFISSPYLSLRAVFFIQTMLWLYGVGNYR